MGHFNVACSISNISISGGDKVAYIPLALNRYPYSLEGGNNLLIYKHCFYSPATLPIFGTYDSYGGIERVERNDNVKLIEKYYDCPIEDIIHMELEDFGGHKFRKSKSIVAGMFIHREIFEHLKNNNVDINGRRDNWGTPTRKELFNDFNAYRKALLETVKDNKKTINTFLEMDKNSNLESLDLSLFEIIEHSVEKVISPWNDVMNERSYFKFNDYQEFKKMYSPEIMKGNFNTELIDFILFEASMYSVNCFYFPAMNGWQDGNKYASASLYKKSLSIMVKNILSERYEALTWNLRYEIRKLFRMLRKKD